VLGQWLVAKHTRPHMDLDGSIRPLPSRSRHDNLRVLACSRERRAPVNRE
jgi:hypothetical protein